MDEARLAGFSPYGIELNRLQADSIRDKLSLPCESRSIADAFPGEQFDVIYHATSSAIFPIRSLNSEPCGSGSPKMEF